MTETKQCTKCQAVLALDNYYRKSPTRLMSWCKSCHKAATTKWAAAHPEKVLAAARKTYTKNKEAVLIRSKQRRLANPDAARAKDREYDAKRIEWRKAYRAANTERTRQRNADYRATNADAIKAAAVAYRAERREILKERSRLWRLVNPEAAHAIAARWKRANKASVNAASHRKRALMRGCAENFTAAEWESLKAAADHTCLWCGLVEPEIKLCVDHVVPVSKGGGNGIGNIQCLCKSCNSRKHTKDTDFRTIKAAKS